MTPLITHYKILFIVSWTALYLIFPSWALPISVKARSAVFSGLLLYFLITAYLMNRWLNALFVDKPLIIRSTNPWKLIKENVWLVIVCLIAAALHIYPILRPILIIGDETLHLKGGLWIYEYIDSSNHLFIRTAFWVLVVLFFVMSKLKVGSTTILETLKSIFRPGLSGNLLKYFYALLFLIFLFSYFFLLRELPYHPILIRYPPVSKFIYLMAYSAFGINHIFPRFIQLIFYLLSAVYLYRTILMFYEKETALLGASIYLFLPVVFMYASLGELACGEIFLIITSVFYFIRFIRDGDNRDILITAYLMGTGYLYKDPILLMLVICFIFVTIVAIQKRSLHYLMNLKILSLSVLTIVPWMVISKLFNWRNYKFVLSNLTSIDGKLFKYMFLIQSNISLVIFILFVFSACYMCYRNRNYLTALFGFVFIAYYFAIVSDMAVLSPRLSMTLYPTISVFLAIFISSMIHYVNWRHAAKFCFIVLTAYMIVICSVYPLNKRYLNHENKKLYYYPSENAMKWVKDNVKEGERVLTIRILSSEFYRYKYAIARDRLLDLLYDVEEVSTPEKLKEYCGQNNITYLMFPYSAAYIQDDIRVGIFEYLKNNFNKEFIEVASFNLENMFIYIYKLRAST
ncbi:MAG: glycosyltransferase family 39 protein [Nitrospirota bacterium]